MSDTVVRYRPFWSLLILCTERWLDNMSLSGLHLCDLNFRGRFIFKEGKPQKYRYCFVYTKFEDKKSVKKATKGWEKIAYHDKWSLYRSAGDPSQNPAPNRRGLYLRNNSLLCLYALISSIILLAALGLVFGLFAFKSSSGASNDDFFRRAVTIIGVFALLILCNFLLFLTMTSANNRILEEPSNIEAHENAYRQFVSHKTFERWLEKLLIKDGDIVKRHRVIWLMTPRGLENWLTCMERKGYNLYKIARSGAVFYFVKSSPRNIKYCVINSEGGNLEQCEENGWQVIYSTVGRLGRFMRVAVLSHQNAEDLPLPFCSEKEYVSSAAHIMLKLTVIYFIFLTIFLSAFFALAYFEVSHIATMITGTAAVIFTLLIVRLLVYFANTVANAKKMRFRPYQKK